MIKPDDVNRLELHAQLDHGPDRDMRLWYFDIDGEAHELVFLEVKFEDGEIVVEMGEK